MAPVDMLTKSGEIFQSPKPTENATGNEAMQRAGESLPKERGHRCVMQYHTVNSERIYSQLTLYRL